MFGKVLEFMAERFFDRDRDHPRVAISLKHGEARVVPAADAPAATVRVTWNLKLALSNESPAPAADLKLVWPGEPFFQAAVPYHLGTFGETAISVRIERTLPREQVEGLAAEQLVELAEPTFLLTYRDIRGDYFHTRYTRRGGQESSEFLKKLPRG